MTDYSVVERSTTVAATPQAVLPLLVDFHRWVDWSPWEGLDPDLKRSYSGADSGVGAAYEWSGNRKAGAGRMEIVGVADDSVDIDLQFTKPFTSTSEVRFDLQPAGDGTTAVVWQMRTPKTLGMRLFGLVMNLDKVIGRDIEKGLASIKRLSDRA